MIPRTDDTPGSAKKPQQQQQQQQQQQHHNGSFATTTTGSTETGWFSDIKSLAKSTKETFLPAIDGIASIIHRSAMTVAAEIAQLERDAELEAERWRADNYGSSSSSSSAATTTTNERTVPAIVPLPWETQNNNNSPNAPYVSNEELKLKILRLGTDERTFLGPFNSNTSRNEDFCLTESIIDLIRRLLQIDENLATMHARLSGRSHLKETIFWRNYFHHCELVRRAHLANTASLPQEDEADSMRSSLGSLVPAESAPLSGPPGQDDGSYVCVRKGIASPPSSLNTLTETMSVGDIVVVGADGNDMNTLDMK